MSEPAFQNKPVDIDCVVINYLEGMSEDNDPLYFEADYTIRTGKGYDR